MGIFQRARDAMAVRRVLTGDPDAFRAIVSAYGGAVQWVAYAHLGNREEAEEVCQETFLKAFQSLHSLREISQLGHWLLSIARNLSRDVLRKRAREAESISQSAAPDAVHPQPDRMEVHERVRAHLNALDDDDREVLVLCYFDGCRAPEIANLLGISSVAARKRLQRARQVLGKRLVRELGDDIVRTKPTRPNTEKYMALVLAAPISIRPDIASGVTKTGGIIMAVVSKKVAVGMVVGMALCATPAVVFHDRIFNERVTEIPAIPLKFVLGKTYRLADKYSFSKETGSNLMHHEWECAVDIHVLDVDAQGNANVDVTYQSFSDALTPVDKTYEKGMAKLSTELAGRGFTCTITRDGDVNNV